MPFITVNDFENINLGAGITAAATSATLATGKGAQLPVVAAPDRIACVITEAGVGTEYIDITGHTAASDTITIERAKDSFQSGTATAFAFTTAAKITAVVTKRIIEGAQPQFLATQTAAPAAKAGGGQLFMDSFGGRPSPVIMPPGGDGFHLQPHISTNSFGLYKPNNGTTAGLNLGAPWSTANGTISHPAIANTSLYASIRKTRWANVATTTNQALGVLSNAGMVWRGNAAGLGGFWFHARVAFPLFPAGTRVFVGLSHLQSTAMVTGDPSTAVASMIGLAMDAADTNLTLMHCAATATATKDALSPAQARVVNAMYDVFIYCAPNSSVIHARVDLIGASGAPTTVYDADVSTALPLNTHMLAAYALMSNGTANTTVTTVAIEVASLYFESDW